METRRRRRKKKKEETEGTREQAVRPLRSVRPRQANPEKTREVKDKRRGRVRIGILLRFPHPSILHRTPTHARTRARACAQHAHVVSGVAVSACLFSHETRRRVAKKRGPRGRGSPRVMAFTSRRDNLIFRIRFSSHARLSWRPDKRAARQWRPLRNPFAISGPNSTRYKASRFTFIHLVARAAPGGSRSWSEARRYTRGKRSPNTEGVSPIDDTYFLNLKKCSLR